METTASGIMDLSSGTTTRNSVDEDVAIVQEWQQEQQQSRNIAHCLMARQETTGLSLATKRNKQCNNYPRIQPHQLASAVAWNAERMQNMVLAVGPGTPATLCWPAGESDDEEEDEPSSSSSSSEDEEELEEEDAVMMNVEDETVEQQDEHEDDHEEEHSPTVAAAAAATVTPSSQGRRSQWLKKDDSDREEDNEQQHTQEAEEEEAQQEDPTTTANADQSILRHAAFRSILTQAAASSRNTRPRRGGGDSDDDEANNNDNDNEEQDAQESLRAWGRRLVQRHERRAARIHRRNVHVRRRGRTHHPPSSRASSSSSSSWMPSMRHGGCINTACWMDCPWRLTRSGGGESMNAGGGGGSLPSTECPTQLATSGDDRVVKIWDMSMAMGMGNVQPGGWDTFAPFAYTQKQPTTKDCLDNNLHEEQKQKNNHQHHHHHGNLWTRNRTRAWRDYYYNQQDDDGDEDSPCFIPPPPGSVLPLATIPTGHGGNVFHVTPVPSSPGKILTCAADGYLRLLHVESATSSSSLSNTTSSVVIHPMERAGGGGGGGGDDDSMSDNSDSDTLSFLFRSAMAYSHHMVNENTGLLCSDRGLHRFDLRVPPRQQQRKSLISSSSIPGSCKACAIWNPNQRQRNVNYDQIATDSSDYSIDSNYVFAGGSSEYVGLYDLRMTPTDTGTGNSSSNGQGSEGGSRIIERYKPRDLQKNGRVSVSGLDVSKDGRELLVSYESDQIYSFPICHEASSPAGPTLDEMEKWSVRFSSPIEDEDEEKDDSDSGNVNVQSDLMAYGGHLNRLTFLKNAKYAGPNDDYICTGSDGGHAWIYERSTGTVVSLLSADTSTCNGVIPHPSLPFFVTYGIDSTAKLWRATLPVDSNADDSPRGRARAALEAPYEMSPVTRSYNGVQLQCRHYKEEPAVFPDYIASQEEIAAARGRYSSQRQKCILEYNYEASDNNSNNMDGMPPPPRIGNAIRTLPIRLRQNRYECYHALHKEDEGAAGVPIDSSLYALSHRVSLLRLRHQADRLGLKFDLARPWAFLDGGTRERNGDDDDDDDRGTNAYRRCDHPADLVPDNPSDWLNLDGRMRSEPLTADITSNLVDYEQIFLERDPQLWSRVKTLSRLSLSRNMRRNLDENANKDGKEEDEEEESVPWLVEARLRRKGQERKEADENIWPAIDDLTGTPMSDGTGSDGADVENEEKVAELSKQQCEKSRELLYETCLLLKEGGNVAMKQGYYQAAARRYDKAIQYCAVAFMNYVEGKVHLPHLTQGLGEDVIETKSNGGRSNKKRARRRIVVVWSPLLRVLITSRLNMSLLLLKRPNFCRPNQAADQAKAALRLLGPFAVEPGKVVLVMTNDPATEKVLRKDESTTVFHEAKALQAKAFFRLGSAEMELGNYAEAVESFELALEASASSSAETTKKPDALVTRRLQEAKSRLKSKKKRDRRKFEFALGEMYDDNTRGTSS